MLCLALGSIAAAQEDVPAVAEDVPAEAEDDSPIIVEGWSKKPRWRGKGPMPRHHIVAIWGIPEPYAEMSNPMPKNYATLRLGKAIYTEHCASCHGKSGAGDGPEGKGLDPSPGNLVWLSDVPEKEWDPYIYWTTAEGGIQLGTDMPAYKDLLSKEDIWAASAYIQANLPFVSQWRFK
jgi:mono/diheme cytochrome c family protein